MIIIYKDQNFKVLKKFCKKTGYKLIIDNSKDCIIIDTIKRKIVSRLHLGDVTCYMGNVKHGPFPLMPKNVEELIEEVTAACLNP